MDYNEEKITVAIIGAGVSGLTLAAFLQKSDITCVVLETQNRSSVETLQRAGVIEARGVDMFERWGLADELLAGPVAQTIDYRVNGESRIFEIIEENGKSGRFCTQQMLVNNLLKTLIDKMDGDVRFDVNNVLIQNEENKPTTVTYSDANGTHEITCDYIIGCDGSRGMSRSSIPNGVLTKYSYEFGYSWLAAHVEAPVVGHPIMAVSDYGFVGQLPRGPQRSRYYLQCDLSDGPQDWSDERFWDEIRLRLNDSTIPNSTIIDKQFVPLRSVVHSPMQYRNLFLAGDVAHLVPPTSAKGMNLALFDVDILAQAILDAVKDNNLKTLNEYSNTCLPHIWTYQDFAISMTNLMHDAGNPTQHGKFRQMTARAQLDTLFNSPAAIRLHSEYQRGNV
ncbi:4-hydroxybenzoate 3-monooxygenase [Flavobacterium sp. MC2016-06]|jgi:p-hydroxybenzoate 3-monooxygenase|uniref:4-hydroxybenzoate 3-monooxygenase n=1 Tax=Flavobacterium sp. MC2016-06 TaxID=2676308 RepID=UPI0012BA5A3E|nr:4-hydroxybenzoate 3-monooxygenase [Flavobacterium sp. MC2016-06]MBU3860400.1 4-hydroxybenzoate 3-monooxygenase [Flavobacterium sp. MC2016-06]